MSIFEAPFWPACHALSHHGARYFGILQVRPLVRKPMDYAWVVGLRNSHDESYPAGLVVGTSRPSRSHSEYFSSRDVPRSIVVRTSDCRAITPSQIPHALREWRRPRHPEFEPRTAWSLFNAFTEVHKRVGPHSAMAFFLPGGRIAPRCPASGWHPVVPSLAVRYRSARNVTNMAQLRESPCSNPSWRR